MVFSKQFIWAYSCRQMMQVVSFSTSGVRRSKTASETRGSDESTPVAWDSKVDKFDQRLAIARKQFQTASADVLSQWEADIRDIVVRVLLEI